MKQFKTVNSILGWITFAIAAFVYCSTIEPSASFWDCPEFITTAYKLEVGHPPGAPFFMLTGNLFTQFVNDPTLVAKMVNTMSALLSATCILFLFWTITHLTRKLINPDISKMTIGQMITIEAAGLVGALAYTFSDTFWFSAVEGEVYAYSSMFTALVFWLMLKWEDHADEPHSDRYLVLIAYLMGLSIGVHLLNLLCIPAMVLVFYYKKHPNADLKGSLLALVVSAVLVVAILYGVVPGIVKVGGWFELFFVNTLHCPFNSGTIVYIVLLLACVIWAIYESFVDRNKGRENISFLLSFGMIGVPFFISYGFTSFIIGLVILAAIAWVLYSKRFKFITARLLNTSLLCMLMLIIGYSSYAVIVIRSTANPPMDQNSPEDIFTLGSYLSRDQYGDRPLLFGQAYTSQVEMVPDQSGQMYRANVKTGAPIYERKEKANPNEPDSYYIANRKTDYVYPSNQEMLFPRIYDQAHAQAYEDWLGGVTGTQVPYDRAGETVMVKMPTQWDNLRFFFSYQLNFMYWRYFMWNFAGRQNDIQGNGEAEHGNWITGFPFIDNLLIGNDMSQMPKELLNNKGYNVFYCMPLILGLIGLFWQACRKNKEGIQQFWVVFFLFFMTGIAIVLYLNQTPQQPRERDYAYAGSFYAYAIWIGLGVAGIVHYLKKKLDEKTSAIIATVLGLVVPIQMASQTWDDHDRSNRYACRDFGQNYLNTLQEKGNPIIFTNGDNDTFPLWYNQDVEGVRTDARVCNLSYLQTDWYIDQMKRKAYSSPPMPIDWKRLDYVTGTNEYVSIQPEAMKTVLQYYQQNPAQAKSEFGDNPYELKNILKYWVLNKNPDLHFIPTDSVVITIDKNAVKRSGMLCDPDSIPDHMSISLKGKQALYKSDLMMLVALANSNWVRPLYIATTVGSENYFSLGDFFMKEGLANRITPFYTKNGTNIDSEKMYNNLMHKFKYGNISDPKVYLDETVLRMCYTHRRAFAELIKQLIKEKKNDKALKALAYCEKVIPANTIPHDYASGSLDLAEAYMLLGQRAKGEAIYRQLGDKAIEYARWYTGFDNSRFNTQDCYYQLYLLNLITQDLQKAHSPLANKYSKAMDTYYKLFYAKGGASMMQQQAESQGTSVGE